MHYSDYIYLELNGEKFFTICCLPSETGRFPVVITRSPYVKHTIDMPEEQIMKKHYDAVKTWLERGYAVVFQHCRGQGKSTGAFVPYVHEREDGLSFREWIRKQSFYNGELYLLGGELYSFSSLCYSAV